MMMPKPIRLTRIVRKMMRSGRLTASLSSFLFRHALDDHRRQRHIVHSIFGARSDGGDAIDHVHAIDDAPEHRGAAAGAGAWRSKPRTAKKMDMKVDRRRTAAAREHGVSGRGMAPKTSAATIQANGS